MLLDGAATFYIYIYIFFIFFISYSTWFPQPLILGVGYLSIPMGTYSDPTIILYTLSELGFLEGRIRIRVFSWVSYGQSPTGSAFAPSFWSSQNFSIYVCLCAHKLFRKLGEKCRKVGKCAFQEFQVLIMHQTFSNLLRERGSHRIIDI